MTDDRIYTSHDRLLDDLAEIERLRAQVAMLREALKPFAGMASLLDDDDEDDATMWVEAGYIRAARAALEKTKEKPE